jgi:lipopolysaccharide export system permease protein
VKFPSLSWLSLSAAPTVSRLFKRDIYGAVVLVLLLFVSLFWFMSLITELADVGQGSYRLNHALSYTLLHWPAHIYELLPVAALIGAVYAMSRMASNSEFTILRSAGMGPMAALVLLLRIGLLLAVITFIFGEFIAPRAEEQAQRIAATFKGKAIGGKLQSGHWVRNVRESDGTVETINISAAKDGKIERIRLYRFDASSRLVLRAEAKGAEYLGNKRWALLNTTLTRPVDKADDSVVQREQLPRWEWDAGLEPSVVNVTVLAPDDMTARDLWSYTQYLSTSGQNPERFKLSLWKKLVYPFTVLVMMTLALPFAYMHARSGGVSAKVFGGIMLGLSFVMLNGVFSQIGLISTLPGILVAVTPALIYTSIALIALAWVMRVH